MRVSMHDSWSCDRRCQAKRLWGPIRVSALAPRRARAAQVSELGNLAVATLMASVSLTASASATLVASTRRLSGARYPAASSLLECASFIPAAPRLADAPDVPGACSQRLGHEKSFGAGPATWARWLG